MPRRHESGFLSKPIIFPYARQLSVQQNPRESVSVSKISGFVSMDTGPA